MSTNCIHNHNLRSKSKQVYNIEVIASPFQKTPETPRTPRILPTVPSSTTSITSLTTSTNSDDSIFRNIRDAEFLERIEALERDLAEIRINNFNIETENSILKDKIINLEKNKEEILTSLVSLEKEFDLLNQYGRRENIELSGIPMDIAQDKLEKVVIDILRFIGLRIDSFDISGCHRINKSSVIIRFVNRKHAIESMKCKKKLNGCKRQFGFNVFMYENLCPAYKSIQEKCRTLMEEGQISKCWSYNGITNLKFTYAYNEKPLKIYHQEDLDYYFPECEERIFF